MKKILSFIALAFILSGALSAQFYTLTVCGQVLDQTTNNPVANQLITLDIPTISGGGATFSYNNTVTTDANGNFCDTIPNVPMSIPQGIVTISTVACNNIYTQSLGFSPNAMGGPASLSLVMLICGSGGNPGCTSSFNHSANALLGINFTNTSSGATSVVWDFGDGNTSTLTNPSHTYASAGTYTVCLIIQCASGADTTCSSVTVSTSGGSGSSSISGIVLIPNTGTGTPASQAEVFLIVFDTANGGTLTAVDTTTVNPQGSFVFSNVAAGDYLIKAALLPASTNYSAYLPTYFASSLFWNAGTTLSVSANSVYTTSIILIAGNNPGGPGFVGGLVSQGANKTFGPGDPLEHVQVMVLDMNNNPVQYTYTNANGEFDFSNLAYGTYKIYIEEFGKTTTPWIVTLSAQTPSIIDLHFEIHSSTVALGAGQKPNLQTTDLSVFPVPVQDMANLKFSLENSEEVSIEILNLNGQQLSKLDKTFGPGNHQLALDFHELASGVYLVKFQAGTEVQVKKIMKR